MNKLTTFLLMASCTGIGSHAAASGIAYKNAFLVSSQTPLFVQCRDLTDEEMDDADNLPGGGYSDGNWSGQNPPNSEDEEGNPFYEPNDDPDKPTYDYACNMPVWDDEDQDKPPIMPDMLALIDIYEDENGNIWIIPISDDEDGQKV